MAFMMNRVKCRDAGYIDFMIATPKHFSCTEAAKVQPEAPNAAEAAFGVLAPHRYEVRLCDTPALTLS